MIYPVLYYNQLDVRGLKSAVNKTIDCLQKGDFKSTDVKKLNPTPYFRAKIDTANRLLFTFTRHQDQTYLLILEIIHNHAYEKSRFLRGTKIDEEQVLALIPTEEKTETLKYLPANNQIHLLDKFIGFDHIQEEILKTPLPLIIIGSAGSGKTSVTLEKLKMLSGDILYVSLSPFLVQHAHKIYFANQYENEDQDIDFLSFNEFIETIEIPKGKEITKQSFQEWCLGQSFPKALMDAHKLFEEILGVMTGSDATKPYLTKEGYFNLGVKQSIYLHEQRPLVYAAFEKYLTFLEEKGYFDTNILSYEYRERVTPRYDALVVDEIQDFTNKQLALLLKSLKEPGQFLLCGDANQIVHPNFFSWSKLKSYFYNDQDLQSHDITRILTTNYRNTPEVTELANRILKFKNYCFGSIDRESHFLIESTANTHGLVNCVKASPDMLAQMNEQTKRSAHYAVLVLYEHHKKSAREFFETPLIFTVQEAKGIEYENIILFNFIFNEPLYTEITKNVNPSFLDSEFKYNRGKEKTDKSLEIYKFYINALYVAVTRSICNVYMLESNPEHTFLQLLNINEIKEVNIKAKQSSTEEWQKEATKLMSQGKVEQAKAIEENILQYKKNPWEPMGVNEFNTLKQQVLVERTASKMDSIKLLNYAIIYRHYDLIETLQTQGLKAAQNIEKCEGLMQDQYFSEYTYKSDAAILRVTSQYGVNFRNIFNLTPLMCAAYVGNSDHIQKIIELGGHINAVDNQNRNAFIIALSKALVNQKYAQNRFNDIYEVLRPDAISFKANNHLIKIDAHKSEFFLLMVLIARLKEKYERSYESQYVFNVDDLLFFYSHFSECVIAGYRKKRTYLSSLLSRNEISSTYPHNRNLFIRIARGFYSINPELEIKLNDEWKQITECI